MSACPVCGFENVRHLIPRGHLPGGLEVEHCPKCGLSWLAGYSPPKDYWDEDQERIYTAAGIGEALRREAEADMRLVELFCGKGRLLDVGCGMGEFLTVAKERGWKAEGLDSSERSIQALRARGLEVRLGSAEEMGFPDESFDAITMRDVLEHLPDPLAALRGAAAALRRGGVLLIRTPNECSLNRMIARGIWRGSFGAIKAPLKFVYYAPHYSIFSVRTFEAALPKLGMKLVRVLKGDTPVEFSREKLRQNYPGSLWAKAAGALIPAVQFAARLTSSENKLIVLARREMIGR